MFFFLQFSQQPDRVFQPRGLIFDVLMVEPLLGSTLPKVTRRIQKVIPNISYFAVKFLLNFFYKSFLGYFHILFPDSIILIFNFKYVFSLSGSCRGC